ncbi:glutaminase [Candidatus Riflebacteria bacterium]
MNDSSNNQNLSPLHEFLEKIHNKYKDLKDGKLASHIPELANVNTDMFGICIVTTDGWIYDIGDASHEFALRNIAGPFTYGLALEKSGEKKVFKQVGIEPARDLLFHLGMSPENGIPFNPLIPAGIITTISLIIDYFMETQAEKEECLMKDLSRFAGRDLKIDEKMYSSDRERGHRKRAIYNILKDFNNFPDEGKESILDLYFYLSSIKVSARDLGIMAATLANGGKNPLTDAIVLKHETVGKVLSVMASCGMNEQSGEWIHMIGVPARSSSAGGIIGVLPGQLGLAVFSPLIDPEGNSVRGINVFKDLSNNYGLHMFNVPNTVEHVIRIAYDAASVNSKRLRPADEKKILKETGNRIKIFELQGELLFSSMEVLLRNIFNSLDEMDYLILDMKRVLGLKPCSFELCGKLLRSLIEQNLKIVLTHTHELPFFINFLNDLLSEKDRDQVKFVDDTDLALEWCENELLLSKGIVIDHEETCPLEKYELMQGFTNEELSIFSKILNEKTFKKGENIIKKGEQADVMYFLSRGQVSVYLDLPSGEKKRLTTFSPGMGFGEMAMLEGSTRAAEVTADTHVTCDALALSDFDNLSISHPTIKYKLLENIARKLSENLRKANHQISTLA